MIFYQSDNVSVIKSKVRRFFENHIVSNYNEHLVQHKKMCTYAQIKSVFKFETYLDVMDDFKKRQCFSKLRMSAHNLEIEAGRFGKNRIPTILDKSVETLGFQDEVTS